MNVWGFTVLQLSENKQTASLKPPGMPEPGEFAKNIGLKYVSNSQPGYRRIKKGKSFSYVDEVGKKVTNPKVLARISALVLPPAWQDVWICKNENGHLQATGRDARGRLQYKYHSAWSQARNEHKFDKLMLFGTIIGDLRKKIAADLSKQGMPKEKVVAAVLKIMEETHIRVGNDTYARENDSYGLTTITGDHVQVSGTKISFNFKGKSGVIHSSSLRDPKLSKIIKRCQELPGEELFAYNDENGNTHDITSDDINRYLKENTGQNLTAKDFRTWGASAKAVEILMDKEDVTDLNQTAWKKCQCEVIKEAASALGNTVAVCRKYYVHPKTFEAAKDGKIRKLRNKVKKPAGLSEAESILLALLS